MVPSLINPSRYTPILADILPQLPVAELTAAPAPTGPLPLINRLHGLHVEAAFAGRPLADPSAARLCVAALLLRADILPAAHAVFQDDETPLGSRWHAFLHRREPDYPNARYWFRRSGTLPLDAPLAAHAVTVARAHPGLGPASWLAHAARWSPVAFVDTIETALRGRIEPDLTVARIIQHAEWELLFDATYRRATGDAADT